MLAYLVDRLTLGLFDATTFNEETKMIIYLNWKGPQGRETVDEIDSKLCSSVKEFRAYVRFLINEYRLAGMDVYKSSRPCSNWTSWS